MTDIIKTYTPEDAAEALRVTPRTVYNYLRKGLIPGRKIGGRWRILEDDLRDFIRNDQAENPQGK